MTNPTETARALLYRHGLPEDVIDGALCLHAQELAAAIREETQRLKTDGVLEPWKYRPCRDAANQIDPTRNEDDVDRAEAALAPLEAAVRADREAQQTARFRRRPLEVQARQVVGSDDGMTGRELALWCGGWVSGTYREPKIGVPTLEGDLVARTGDWIVRGTRGEFWPVKGDIFTETYTPIAAEPSEQAPLRDRIAAALYERERPPREPHWPDAFAVDREVFEAMADAVLAVLPEPTDQATVRAALRDAADQVFALDYDEMVSEQDDENLGSMRAAWNLGTIHATELLRRLADEQPTTPTAPDVKHMLARMRADAATHDIDHLLQLLARWATSSEGRDVLLDDLVAAGYRLPHAYGNCEGVDLAAPAVPVAGAGQAADQAGLREQLLDALDFAYCRGLGYATPEDLLGAYETSRWAALVGEADRLRREGAALNARVEQVDDQVNTLRRAVVLSEPTDQAAVRAAALREAALHLYTALFPAVYNDLGQKAAEGVNRAVSELRRLADEQHAPTTADPIPLRWGLDDIEHGDDDTVTVLLSGPDGRPYWLELDPERANVLREALAETDEHPTTPDCPTPESHNWGCGCPTDQLPLHAQSGIDTPGCDCGHDGMGPKWHARACAWLDTMTVPHPDAVADEPAGPAAPAKEAEGRCPACGHTVCDGDGPCGARSGNDFCICTGAAPAKEA